MATDKLITEQITLNGRTYDPNYRILPSCAAEASTACCSDVTTSFVANNAATRRTHTATTKIDDVKIWYDNSYKGSDPTCGGSRCWSPDEFITDFGCDYNNLCRFKNTLLTKYINAQNIWVPTEIEKVFEWIRNNIDEKICKSAITTTTTTTVGITGGCIDSNASNFCGVCNADCVGVIGGTNNDCCQYTEDYVLKYTYRFCNNNHQCKGGDGTTLKAGETYKLKYGDGTSIGIIIEKIKNKIGDLLIATNIVSPHNLVEYGFFSDDSIPESDLEDFAKALTIIFFGNAAIDRKLKYLDGGDILEDTNTFKYSHVTIYSAGAGQLYLGNYNIISPNTESIVGRIENFVNYTTLDIIKNQLNWLARNNKKISDKVPTKQIIDGEEVWSVTSDIGKSISKLQNMIDKYMPGQYVINDDGSILRESIEGLENLLIEEPIGLGKLLK